MAMSRWQAASGLCGSTGFSILRKPDMEVVMATAPAYEIVRDDGGGQSCA
jgi:hypothetical protein